MDESLEDAVRRIRKASKSFGEAVDHIGELAEKYNMDPIEVGDMFNRIEATEINNHG